MNKFVFSKEINRSSSNRRRTKSSTLATTILLLIISRALWDHLGDFPLSFATFFVPINHVKFTISDRKRDVICEHI